MPQGFALRCLLQKAQFDSSLHVPAQQRSLLSPIMMKEE
jgi:hypothetical protein